VSPKHLITKLYNSVGNGWVDLDAILAKAGLSLSWGEKLKLLLELREEFQLVYDASTDSFLIRRKEQNAKRVGESLQNVVELIRGIGQMPKPQFYNALEEAVGERAGVIYEKLIRDGIIEEVNVGGITLVRTRRT